MYPVSNAWVTANASFLAPEGFVELSCYIPELQQTLVYNKSDLLSFTHQQTGSLVSGELPKNHIEFTLDNSDGKWNPNNPKGLERYLSERLQITLRYGFNIDGVIEWIPGGVFYLSEWRTSLNGIQASFVARDILEYMLDRPFDGEVAGTLYDVVFSALSQAGIDAGKALGVFVLGETALGGVNVSAILKDYTVESITQTGNESIAAIIQKCANAAGCVMYQNRNGVLVIGKLAYEDTGYIIPTNISYSYPEIEFSRPIKSVEVTYNGNKKVVYPFSGSGETQTLSNDLILTEDQALEIAEWVCDSLRTRQKISGTFRGDPRLDLFDVVSVESKYGTAAGVVLTDIKCTFTGAFRMTYSGYIRGSGVAVVVYCGEVFAGEVL